jgi:hypothetical protein
MPYRKGEQTLAFLSRDAGGILRDGSCTSSWFAKEVQPDLEHVQRYFKGETVTSIRGRVAANSSWSMVDFLMRYDKGYPIGQARVLGDSGGKTNCLVGEICGSPMRSDGRRKLGSRSPRNRCGIARLQLSCA